MKNTVKLMTICTAMLFISTSSAQVANGTIKGKVFEGTDSSAIIFGASVFVKSGTQKIGATTDTRGQYKITAVPPGIYNVTISHISYQNKVAEEIEVKPNSIAFVPKVYLGGDSTLKTFHFRPKNLLIDKEDPTRISKSYKKLQHSPNIQSPAKLINNFSSDIKMAEDGKLYFRGARSDATTYYIDGVRTRGLKSVPGMAIGSMTVYTGGVPAKYGDTTGGVVMIETKSYTQLYNAWKAKKSRENSDF